MSTEHHIARDDLFAGVWERAMTKVAAVYGIADDATELG